MASYVLSLIGTDRTGLVEALSEVVTDFGGNWERSHLTELAGTFAGVVLVTVPSGRADAFRSALAPLRDQGLLDVTVQEGPTNEASDGETTVDEGEVLCIDLVGNDRAGIVHDVATLLASLDVGIIDLRTWTASAPHAGGSLFHATAIVRLPSTLGGDALARSLEELTNELMVDVSPAVPPTV